MTKTERKPPMSARRALAAPTNEEPDVHPAEHDLLAHDAGVCPTCPPTDPVQMIGFLDDKHTKGEFAFVDNMLRAYEVGEAEPRLLLAMLNATIPAREHLPARPSFVDRCFLRLSETLGEERAAALLRNRR